MTPREPLERLTVATSRARPRQPAFQEQGKTERHYFDRFSVNAITFAPAANNASFAILTLPQYVERAEIIGLAVMGAPVGTFQQRVGWQLLGAGGGLQEFITGSLSITGTPTGADAGLRFGDYGTLSVPHPLSVELRQGEQVSIRVVALLSAVASVVLTVYSRITGFFHVRRPA